MNWLTFRERPMWKRKPVEICRACGLSLALPGEYRAIENRIVMHWDCWESLPDCARCGRGVLRLCEECR